MIAIVGVVAQNHETIRVSWETTFDGNSDLELCTVEYQQAGSMDWVIATTEADGTLFSYDITGLMPYTEYLVRLMCNNEIGDSNSVIAGPERTGQFSKFKLLNQE